LDLLEDRESLAELEAVNFLKAIFPERREDMKGRETDEGKKKCEQD